MRSMWSNTIDDHFLLELRASEGRFSDLSARRLGGHYETTSTMQGYTISALESWMTWKSLDCAGKIVRISTAGAQVRAPQGPFLYISHVAAVISCLALAEFRVLV